jgi:hypothetical protein
MTENLIIATAKKLSELHGELAESSRDGDFNN